MYENSLRGNFDLFWNYYSQMRKHVAEEILDTPHAHEHMFCPRMTGAP